MAEFFIGLDLGQKQDSTAVAVVERHHGDRRHYTLRHLERVKLGTSFVDVVARGHGAEDLPVRIFGRVVQFTSVRPDRHLQLGRVAL